ncbi:hypothetical protein [Vibrio ezurae]|uniref:hypothetical protein n=1 Tax=Vibrio ezurae TaxID=252583 RepID=UPI000408621C|nr:hypothetical protein [Vibrio ezurae]
MKRLSKIQIQELTSLGLTQHQIEECESVLINVPPLFDEKKVNMLKNFLSKAEKILDEFERNDPRLFNEIQSFLGDGILLEQKPLSCMQDALSTVKQNQTLV